MLPIWSISFVVLVALVALVALISRDEAVARIFNTKGNCRRLA